MMGDPDAKRGGVTGRVVKATLEEQLPTICEPGSIFQQDNAPVHQSALVQTWLREFALENGVQLRDWPPYSPDLNPIENAWKIVKDKVVANHPDLLMYGCNNEAKQRLCEAAVEEWEAIEDGVLEKLVESMPRRCAAVVAAGG
ncbi:hypothetical protein CDD80_6567 [Ophiocordyceps camponoti-rufipedis]|uniref:Tc1-like transposase DDE domain-containing protein n=1 Tax=Ophiocordyceps camponoti-rufipedis TaxID=2004952 RepID=A0A2C5YRZ5_9HYPO|nr:hypothetical protein CDD80_6567 [Ophiocordyceps camponoti-rufipedis]